jgi:PAS domain S-box-containing protein
MYFYATNLSFQTLEYQSTTDFRTVFNALPGASALVLADSPVFTVVASTDEFAAFGGAPKDKLIGDSLFRYFPDNPDAPNVSGDIRASLEKCIHNKKKNELAVQRYDIANTDGTFSEMYWTVIHTPILNENGEISLIIHTAIDVTARILADIKDEKIRSLEPAYNLFLQSTVAIHIFKGPDLIITLANEPTLRIWGKDKSVIGKPLKEVLPEFDQKYIDLIHMVRNTKESYREYEAPVLIHRNGNDEMAYLNLVFQPYYEFDKSAPTGVLAMVSEVTDIHNDRKVLVEKERSLELAIAIAGLGVFSIDFNSGNVSLSPQIMEWLDVTTDTIPLVALLPKIHSEDIFAVNDTLDQLIKEETGRRHDVTFRAKNPKTEEWQFLRSIGQVQMENGLPVSLLGIIQDITKSVHTQETLEQSAQRLRSFIDSAPFPIGVYIGKEMRIEMCNQAILDVWGRNSDVIGKCYADVLPELSDQGIYEQLDEVYTTGKAFHAHQRRIDLRINGILQPFYFNYSFTPLFDSDGNVYGVMNTAAEVTDLVLTQKALRESERNFRMIILEAPVAMCLMRGPYHVVELANESMISLWGKPRDEVMNKPVFEGLPEAKEQGLEQLLAHVYRTGETITANERPVDLVRYGTKETVYQNFVYQPYRDGNEKIIGVLAISIDVTDQVLSRFKIEEMVAERTLELELSNTSLQKSNAELEQFAYVASHDLQEPLRKINMFTGMLQNILDGSNDKAQGLMNNISLSVNRMTNLIRDVLSYSQVSRMQEETFERVNLEEIFAEAINDFDLVIEEKHAVIRHSGLPMVEAIPLQMVQLFHNLISNALKYSRENVHPVINITAEPLTLLEALQLGFPQNSTPYYRIIFSDNGIGFSQEYASKIFNIFQRLHSRGQYEGTGIGLAICKKIAENHHGTIYADSVENEGTEFIFVLPQTQPNKPNV